MWAFIAAGEGILRTIAAVAAYAIMSAFKAESSALQLDKFTAQWRGLVHSVIAIASPNRAKESVYDGRQIMIGPNASKYLCWGTSYKG
jgi:hypothetical protein